MKACKPATTRHQPPCAWSSTARAERNDEPAFTRITPTGEPIDAETAARIVRAYTEELCNMVKAGEQQASKQSPAILQQAHSQPINTLQVVSQKALVKAIDNAVP